MLEITYLAYLQQNFRNSGIFSTKYDHCYLYGFALGSWNTAFAIEGKYPRAWRLLMGLSSNSWFLPHIAEVVPINLYEIIDGYVKWLMAAACNNCVELKVIICTAVSNHAILDFHANSSFMTSLILSRHFSQLTNLFRWFLLFVRYSKY